MPKLSGEGGRGGSGRRRKRRGGGGGVAAQHGAPGALRDKQTHGGTTTHTVQLSDGSGTYTPPKPAGWIIRRQKLLRQAGFNIPVDGVWGARSQGAWDRFNKRIGNASGLTGKQMVQRSQAAQRIERARREATGAIRDARLRATRLSLGNDGPPTAQHGAPMALGQSRADFDRNVARYYIWQQNNKIIHRLTGTTLHRTGTRVEGARTLRQAAEQGRITADDLRFLGDHGALRIDRQEDVRVTQIALNHLLGDRKVEVTGQWDIQTASAMRDFIIRDDARKYRKALHWTQKNLIDTGIADRITRGVIPGPYRVTSAAQVIALLSQDTPLARRLSRRFATAYEHELEDRRLLALQDERSRAIAGIGPGDDLFGGGYAPDALFALAGGDPFDQLLGRSTSLRGFAKDSEALRLKLLKEQNKQRAEEMRKAREGHGFFMDALGTVGDVLGWSGHQGAKLTITWSDVSLSSKTGIHPAGPLGPLTDVIFGSFLSEDGNNLASPSQTVEEAWNRSEITLDAMPGWQQMVYESLFDPLNFVGAGLITNATKFGLRTGSRALLRSGEFVIADHVASTLGVTATNAIHSRLLGAALTTTHLAETVDLSRPIRRSVAGVARGAARTLPPAARDAIAESRLYKMATTARGVAYDRAQSARRELKNTVFRNIAHSSAARVVGSRFEQIAARQEEMARLIDPEVKARTDTLVFHQQQHVAEFAPDLVDHMASWGTSLFAHYLREGGTTSFAGTRVMAHMAERVSQGVITRLLILEDLAKRGIADDVSGLSIGELRAYYEHSIGPAKLNTLLQEAGSYKAGHVAYRFIEDFERERKVAMERIYDILLPTLDDLVRQKAGDSMWHLSDEVVQAVEDTDADLERARKMWADFLASEGDEAADDALELADRMAAGEVDSAGKEVGVLLRDEDAADIRASLDSFFGYSVDEAFNPRNWVKFKNPNYGVRVTEAGKKLLAETEKERVAQSIIRWGETVKRTARITDPEKLARIDAAVARRIDTRARFIDWSWKPHADGGWVDTRKSLRAPGPTVRNVTQRRTTPALDQLDRLTDAVLDLDRLAKPNQTFLLDPAKQAAIAKVADTPAMRSFARESEEYQRFLKVTDQKVGAVLFRQNGLVWNWLRESQAIPARMAYFAAVKMLNVWKFAALALRPAFVVRNVADNFLKMFTEGLRDPRFFFNPEGKSIFEMGLVHHLLGACDLLDQIFLTNVRGLLEYQLEKFWTLHPELVAKIIGMHDIHIPAEVIEARNTIRSFLDDAGEEAESATAGFSDELLSDVDTKLRDRLANAPVKGAKWVKKFPNVMWELMADRPETYAKRILFLNVRQKALRRGATETEAVAEAVEAVDRTLFDYSKVTVLEDNLKVLFPFIFFWRKNANFWLHHLEKKPWLFADVDRWHDAHDDSNSDQPEWMRRYVNLAPVASITDVLPTTSWMSGWLRDSNNFDPMSYVSFNQFYNAFKKGNPDLADDQKGWRFISDIVDGFTLSSGLGINPYLSEIGQRLGALNRHNWQDIFPETTLIQSLTSKQWIREKLAVLGVDAPMGLNLEDVATDPLWGFVSDAASSQDLTRDRFDQLVNREMAEQRARGDVVNRHQAEERVRAYYLVQTVVGFGIGIFPKRISPESRAMYQLSDQLRGIYLDPDLTPAEAKDKLEDVWRDLTPEEQDAYRLFKAKGYSPEAFDKYRRGLAAADAYYGLDDWQDKQQFLADHPEAVAIVHPETTSRFNSEHYIQTQILLARTDAVSQFANTYLSGIGAPGDVQNVAYSTLVTPSLRAFWRKNDTPQEIRNRHMRGSFFRYLEGVQSTYFTIPHDDFAGQQRYLDQHPELLDYWRINDSATDDFRSIYRNANSAFREVYFHFVDQGDWDSAEEYLRRHPFIFDYTSAEGRVTPGGRLIPSSEHQGDYAQVADQLRVYWSLAPQQRATYAVAHPAVLAYIKKYGATDGMYAQAVEYDKLRDTLAAYFRLPNGLREAYLNRHPELRAYFAKYGHDRTLSQHARDYLAVKGLLDQFFALPEGERDAFLRRHPEVQAYFDKYGSKGKNAHGGGSFEGKLRVALAQNPEVAARYEFWQTFFALPPDKRPAFIHHHAEAAGVFIYGSLSYAQQQKQIARDHRLAIRLGLSDKQVLYRRVAPMLDLYFSLPEGSADRAIFLQTNPDLARYLDVYAKQPLIKDPKLRRLVERYFLLPAFGADRADFIAQHPEIGRYFNRDASPAEAAMQRQIDRFFKLPFGPERDQYLATHPELKHYFDQREREHSLYGDIAAAFNSEDPRMEKFRDLYADIVPLGALKQWALQRQRADQITQAPSREDTGRQPDDGEDGALTRRRSRTGDVS